MRVAHRMITGPILLALAACSTWAVLAVAAPAAAQSTGARASPRLNAALARLGRDPRDASALIDAGDAALAMGDADAAIGFFTRADQVLAGSPRVKAGLASAFVRNENPFEAIPMFIEAERVGATGVAFVAERGLAYDLVGDNATAQKYYRQALTAGPNDEVSRRLALSLAMGGDRQAADKALSPLLQKQDRASWRTRAFALAIVDQTEEAVAIARSTLPAQLSASIAPYLRYMPRLTRAQQAAAANFGHFPRASEIGRDDPRVARFATAGPRRTMAAGADSALIPRGQPLGRDARKAEPRRTVRVETRPTAARAASPPAVRLPDPPRELPPPDPRPARQSEPLRSTAPAPRVAAVAPAPRVSVLSSAPAISLPAPAAVPSGGFVATAVSMPATSVAAQAKPVAVAPASASGGAPSGVSPPSPSPGFDLAILPAAAAAAPAATPAADSGPPSTPAASLADAFRDFAPPAVDAAPAEGAVDVRAIAPVRVQKPEPKPSAAKPPASKDAKPAKAAPPKHPSRIWVQVATGRDKAALAWDWRRIKREANAVLRGKNSYVADWGQTNRLVTGPFASEPAANAFLAELRKAKIGGAFLWTSTAGEAVDPLPER